MRTLVIGVLVGIGVLLFAGCGGSSERSDADEALQRQADLYAIGQLQKTFHKAVSQKDIDLMMTIWAPNATYTQGPGQTMVGTDEIRSAWLATKPFQPTVHWMSETPAYKIRATVNGDKGTLFFECHFIDTQTKMVGPVTAADMQVARIDGRWLVTSMVGGSATLSP
jgi:ketosteroid isomerase-like protein